MSILGRSKQAIESATPNLMIGVVQYSVQTGNIEENLNQVRTILEQHSTTLQPKLDLLLLPEMGLTGFQYSKLNQLAEKSELAINELIKVTAPYTEAVAVSIPVAVDKGKIVNRLTIHSITDDLARYDKIHCIGHGGFQETDYFFAGKLPVVFEYKGWLIGLSICYDLRFPELYRQLKADLYLVPSQWPTARHNQMLILAQARAIENQAYLALANTIGKNGHLEFIGGSQIIDFNGNRMTPAVENQGIAVAVLSHSKMQKWRNDFPVLKDITINTSNN